VGGEIVAANGDTVGAIFRIHLVSASPDSAHRLDRSRIDTVWRELAHPRRRFTGMTVLSDNSYLAARDGSDNSSLIDPDARVLVFDKNDKFITPMPAFVTGTGTGIANINHPTSVTAFPNSRDSIRHVPRIGPLISSNPPASPVQELWLLTLHGKMCLSPMRGWTASSNSIAAGSFAENHSGACGRMA
jgi:hypothetical protein